MQSETFDIAIVGAGPAGSTAALALGKSNLRVALIDKCSFPREKICGGAVASYVPKVLNTINPDYVTAFREFYSCVTVDTCCLVAPNGKKLNVTFSDSGIIAKREDFDTFLFNLASKLPNVKCFNNEFVTNVFDNKDGVLISLKSGGQIEAKLIIGCDGSRSIVRRKLTQSKPDVKHHCIAARAYFRNVEGIPKRSFELHYTKRVEFGYLWIFPLPNNYANVGVGMHSQSIRKNSANLKELLLQEINENTNLRERFKNSEMVSSIEAYDLPLGSRKVQISGNRFMLCGDAASLIDPATGEGIGHAMVSGRYAGWQAIRCFEKNDFSAKFMKAYNRDVYKKVWGRNRRMYFIQQILGNNFWLIDAIVGICSKNRFAYRFFKKLIM